MGGKICLLFLLVVFTTKSLQINVESARIDKDEGKSSLVFVFDTTGSMHNDLRQLREGAEMIMTAALEEGNVIADFVFVPFHDPAVGPPTVTKDKEVLKSALSKVHVYGGGDCPEKSLGGIKMALEVSRPRSFVYVFTDATASDHRIVGKVLDMIQRTQSQVVFVLTGHCSDLDKPSYKVYDTIATASSGQVFNLNKTSVHKVLDFVRTSIKGKTVNLAATVNPPGYNYTREIPVDKSVGEVTVSVSGSKPQIHVINPSGDELLGPPQLVTTLDLSEIMVVKVLNPEPGNWSITVGSEEQHSVRVVGLSNLTFQHGFSVQPPTSMLETSYRPLQGTYNHLLISLTGTDRPLILNYAQILTLDGKTLFEVPLKPINNTVYVADAFIPPEDLFYIAIAGRDEYNQEVRRVGYTAVQANTPDAPYLVAPKKVTARPHERVVLTCHVESLVPVMSMWMIFSSIPGQRINTLQSTSINFVIEDANLYNEGLYTCIAKNVAGQSQVDTYLEIKVDPPTVEISQPKKQPLEGEEFVIHCSVFSEVPLLQAIISFDGTMQKYSKPFPTQESTNGHYDFEMSIQHASKRDEGTYSCIFSNIGGKSTKSTNITIQTKPIAQILGPHTFSTNINTDVQFVCHVENALEIRWLDPSKNIFKRIDVNGTYNAVLDIRNMTQEGTWTCVAVRDSLTASDSVDLTVLIKPRVSIEGPKNITVVNGTMVHITCTIVAKPSPRILWHRETEEFLPNTVTKLEANTYKSVLTLNSSSENIKACYFCIGENSEGIGQDIITVNVRRKMTVLQGFTNITVELYSKVLLPCKVDSFPLPTITWYHNGTEINMEEQNRVSLAEDDTSLYVDGVDFDDLGAYMCVASNEFENVTILGTINVIDDFIQPQVSIEGDKNVTMLNGTVAYITCKVAAKPKPRIYWHSDTRTNLNYTVISVQSNVYKSILAVNASSSGLEATYYCSGENAVGKGEDSIFVTQRRKMRLLESFSDTSVEIYKPVVFKCDVESYPSPNITWYHNGTIIKKTGANKVHFVNTSLHIERADFDDLGEYVCDASNGFENIKAVGTLSFHRLAPPLIFKEQTIVKAKRGEALNLTCRVLNGSPTPKITWLYRNSIKNITALPKNISINNHSIYFKNLTRDNEGIYRCIADNVIGKDIYDIALTVLYPPQIENTKELHLETPQEIQIGDKFTLSCNFTASPPPTVVWSKDGRPIAYTSDMYLSSNGDLIVEHASELTSGVFTCNASNPLGSVLKNFTVNVYMAPKITVSGVSPEVDVLEGQLVELLCSASSLPPPQVQWWHNGETIVDGRKMIDTTGLRFVANLTDFGDYSCLATNEYGSASLNYTLYVWVAPYIKNGMTETREVLTGADVELSCDAVGFPVPTVHWEFQDEALNKTSPDLSFNATGGLSIRNASLEHEGLYACVAENGAGVAVKYFMIIVNEMPSLLKDNFPGPYIATDADSAVSVGCRAAGKPQPYVYWIKDGYFLDRDVRYKVGHDGTLTIDNPTEDLSGVYTCMAKNALGNVTRDVIIKIYPHLNNVAQSDESSIIKTAIEGKDVEIHCPIGSGADTVKWYKDAVLISSGTLKLLNVSRAHSGEYACVVTNAVSSAHARLTIDVQWSPRFLDPANDVAVVAGEDVYLDCRVDAKPRAKTKWLFNSKPVLGEDKERLKILNAQIRHTGVYKCIVRNEHGTVFKQFTLDVLEPPRIKYEELDVQLKAGSSATLECDAKGSPKPKITWLFNNTNWSVQNSSVVCGNVSAQCAGEVRCSASNSAGVASLVYHVTIVVPARVAHVMLFDGRDGGLIDGSADLVLGTRARIACKATGNPLPKIKWIRYGNAISQNSENVGYADLELPNVELNQAGEYICVASNEGGFDERKIKINVLEPPKIYQTLFENSNSTQNIIELQVISGQAFFMHCHPYGNPLPEVYWFKDGLPLRLYDDSMVSTEFGEVIATNSAKLEHTGNYTCVARNSIGEASSIYLVDVLVAPQPQKESVKQMITTLGQQLNLSCPAEGSPAPYVRWIKLPYTDLTDSNRIVLLNDNYTMLIQKTQASDSGKYTCIITNKVGSTEVTFDVIVEKAPSIVGNTGDNNTESHLVALGRSIVLKCEADGHPPPKITWLKDIQQLTDRVGSVEQVLGGSILALWAVGLGHAGRYSCVAQNNAGLTHRKYDLNVQVPGKWSEWSQWSYCNVTCGLGYQTRSRRCQYIHDTGTVDKTNLPTNVILDESGCKGSSQDRRKCHMPACEWETSRAGWSAWSRWSACSSTCGAGSQARTRRCRGPPCADHDNVQIRKCPGLPKCPDINRTTNDESNNEDTNNPDYLPAVTYEMPEENDSTNINVEEYYPTDIDVTKPVYYDVNVTENLDHSDRGPCAPGFRYSHTDNTCNDIDECLLSWNMCHSTQTCANAAPGYRCGCPRGYRALAAGQRCLDINECTLEVHGCEWACVNVAGGFVCACPAHLRLHPDRRRCVPPSYNKYSYEENESEGYLSTSIEYPARYLKTRN